MAKDIFERLNAGRPPPPKKTARHELSLPPAQKLLNWLQQDWTEPTIGARDIYRHGPNAVRNRRSAINSAEILVKHGILVPTKARRRDMIKWQVVRMLDK